MPSRQKSPARKKRARRAVPSPLRERVKVRGKV